MSARINLNMREKKEKSYIEISCIFCLAKISCNASEYIEKAEKKRNDRQKKIHYQAIAISQGSARPIQTETVKKLDICDIMTQQAKSIA